MYKTRAYAKLDLGIHINPKKNKDGYYSVCYIDTLIEVYDELMLTPQHGGIEVVTDSPELNNPKENFAYKVAFAMKKLAKDENLGVKIKIKKNIPIRAGFGGGSSDGAATALTLSNLWNVQLAAKVVRQLTHEFGKDFYYTAIGGLCEIIGQGKTYKMAPIDSKLPDFWLLVAVPNDTKPSTGWVYEHLKTSDLGRNFAKIKKLKAAILKRDKMGILDNLTNDFEPLVSSKFPIVSELKEAMTKNGALASIMAGAGLSVVGFFEGFNTVQKAKKELSRMKGIKQTFVTSPMQAHFIVRLN